GYSLKKMRTLEGATKEKLRMEDPTLARRSRDDLEVEPVELLPHLRAALLAYLAQIFASRRNARNDRRGVGAIERQRVSQSCRINFASGRYRDLQCLEQAQPASRT